MLTRLLLALRPHAPPARQWRPHPAPARFDGLDDLIATWAELNAALRPSDDRLLELEIATLMLFDLRTSDPGAWAPDRVRLLVDLLARLRA